MQTNLQRRIGLVELIAYYVSSIIGVGILVIPGIAMEISGPASLLSWIFLLLVSYPYALFFSRMSIHSPDSAGIAAFVEKRFGQQIGKTVAVLMALTMIIGNPVMGIATARYLQNLFGFADGWPLLTVGFGMMVVSILFNLVGLKLGAKIQTGILFLLAIGLLVVVGLAAPHAKSDNFTPFLPNGWWAVGVSTVVCFFSFLGWENVSTIAEEVKNPERTFKRAILWSIGIIGVLYLAVAIAVVAVRSPGGDSGNITVLTGLLQAFSGEKASRIGDVVAILLLILSTNAWVLGASRLIYALGRDGVLPKKLARVSRSGVPIAALLALAGAYGAVTLFLMVSNSTETELIQFANSNFLIIYLFAFFSGLKVFKERDIRIATWVSLIVTLGFLPFFREGLLYSVLLLVISYLLFRFVKKKEDSTHAYS